VTAVLTPSEQFYSYIMALQVLRDDDVFNMLSWTLAHSPSVDNRHVASIGHIICIPSRPSLLLLLNSVYLAQKQQISIPLFGLTGLGLERMTYKTQGQHANKKK
jgi:hypothetical protein